MRAEQKLAGGMILNPKTRTALYSPRAAALMSTAFAKGASAYTAYLESPPGPIRLEIIRALVPLHTLLTPGESSPSLP